MLNSQFNILFAFFNLEPAIKDYQLRVLGSIARNAHWSFSISPSIFKIQPLEFSAQPYPVGPQPYPVGPQPYPVGPQPYPVGPQPYPVGPQPYPVGPQPYPPGVYIFSLNAKSAIFLQVIGFKLLTNFQVKQRCAKDAQTGLFLRITLQIFERKNCFNAVGIAEFFASEVTAKGAEFTGKEKCALGIVRSCASF